MQTVKGLPVKTIDYLDLAKTRAGLPSDYALANALGVSRQAVSSWRSTTRPRYPEVVHALQIADLCQIDRLRVLADIEFDKAEYYGRVAEMAALQRLMDETCMTNVRESFGKAVGGIAGLLLAGSILISPSPVNASSISPGKSANITERPSVYYVNSRRRKQKRNDRRQRGAIANIARTLFGFSAVH